MIRAAAAMMLSAALWAPVAAGDAGPVSASPRVVATAERLSGRVGTTVDSAMPAACGADFGCADVPAAIIHLRSDLVNDLNQINEVSPACAAWAILVFAHEARHVHGEYGELRAEAWARAHWRAAAVGVGAVRLRAIARWIPRWHRYIIELEKAAGLT